MRKLAAALLAALAALLPSCGGSRGARDPVPPERHLAAADSLERRQIYTQATLEYLLVAQRYPGTPQHPTAVLKTALLYSNPRNPAVNDSIAAYWFDVYRNTYADTDEAAMVELYAGLNERIRMLRGDLRRQTASYDSLAAVGRRQASDLSARTRRIQELEAELAKTSGELKRLKEIDLRLHKERTVK